MPTAIFPDFGYRAMNYASCASLLITLTLAIKRFSWSLTPQSKAVLMAQYSNLARIEQKLVRARVQLLLHQPFFGTLCLRLKLVPGSVPTMATNGKLILYNPAFVEWLTPAELEGALSHETMHCALGHHCRRGQRDPKGWNDAADYAINPIIIRNKLSLPKGVLIDPEYDGLSAEEIYARRLREPQGNAPPEPGTDHAGGGAGAALAPPQSQPDHEKPNAGADSSTPQEAWAGGIGEVLDATYEQGKPASPAEQTRQQREWSIAAEQALRTSKSCGNDPGDIERFLQESRESVQDWRAILREFVAATAPSDYRWSPPNRRFVAAGLYLPSMRWSGVGTIVIGVDTSGSIGQRELDQFAAEITAIADEAKPEAIHVVYCDSAVQSVQEFGPSDPIQLAPAGGGGTDFRPVFQWVDDNSITPACLIYLTDLCCLQYPQVPSYPVLWATDSRRAAPFGETIKITAE
jgi:predicted metal-dependent peptidase